MNLAYFRKSSFDRKTTVEKLTEEAKAKGLTILATTELPGKNGTVVHMCNPTWIRNLVASDKNLLGLLPCSVAVIEKDGEVTVGVGSPTVLGSVSQHPAIKGIAEEADKTLKSIVHSSAGVGPLKATSVKLYSTTTCPYCTMEASWLDEKKVTYQKVMVDIDQRAADEMVKRTGQMGVPVTTITYEGGEEEHIVGFDKARLTEILEV